MARGKRGKEQREIDLTKTTSMIILDIPQKDMLKEINKGRKEKNRISRQMLAKDIAEVKARWAESVADALVYRRNRMFAERDEAKKIIWAMVRESVKPADNADNPRSKDVVVVPPSDIPKLFAELRKIDQEDCKILGIYKSVNGKKEPSDSKPLTEEALLAAPLKHTLALAAMVDNANAEKINPPIEVEVNHDVPD